MLQLNFWAILVYMYLQSIFFQRTLKKVSYINKTNEAKENKETIAIVLLLQDTSIMMSRCKSVCTIHAQRSVNQIATSSDLKIDHREIQDD